MLSLLSLSSSFVGKLIFVFDQFGTTWKVISPHHDDFHHVIWHSNHEWLLQFNFPKCFLWIFHFYLISLSEVFKYNSLEERSFKFSLSKIRIKIVEFIKQTQSGTLNEDKINFIIVYETSLLFTASQCDTSVNLNYVY